MVDDIIDIVVVRVVVVAQQRVGLLLDLRRLRGRDQPRPAGEQAHGRRLGRIIGRFDRLDQAEVPQRLKREQQRRQGQRRPPGELRDVGRPLGGQRRQDLEDRVRFLLRERPDDVIDDVFPLPRPPDDERPRFFLPLLPPPPPDRLPVSAPATRVRVLGSDNTSPTAELIASPAMDASVDPAVLSLVPARRSVFVMVPAAAEREDRPRPPPPPLLRPLPPRRLVLLLLPPRLLPLRLPLLLERFLAMAQTSKGSGRKPRPRRGGRSSANA